MNKLPLPSVKKIIAIASGKGGVGKTTVTVNLALALQALGLKIGIFDADIYGPNVPLMLGVRRKMDGEAFVPVVRRADAPPYINPLERFGLQVMSTGLLVSESQVISPLSDGIGKLVLQTMKDTLWDDLDYLLLDLPPSAGQPQQALIQHVHLAGVIIVTTPQSMSLLDASRACQHFQNHNINIMGVVENMSFVICKACGEKTPIFAQPDQERPANLDAQTLLHQIPLDPSFSKRISSQHPLLQPNPSGLQAETFLSLARTVHSSVE